MIFGGILAVLLLLAALTSILAVKLLKISREVKASYENAQDFAKEYFNPRGDGLPSPFADTISGIAQVVGSSVATQIKNTFTGESLLAQRQEKGILQDMAKDQLEQSNPLIAMILQQFPTLQKRLLKNPALLPMATEALSKLGKGAGGDHGRSGESIDYGQALSKYK
ncbi:unnamed protein product [marine sediment metagenome]|uniref:Uncharacterized protein n=1 Tax=marine sediment metagenome TaxID=412755 RepID=X1KFL5_9ZZZZ